MEYWRIVEGDEDAIGAPPLRANEAKIRVTHHLSDDAHRALASLLDDRPDAQLWIDHPVEDLELLRHYPDLRRLGVTSLRLRSFDGVRHVTGTLEELHMGDTLRPVSIAPMGGLRQLTALGLNGPLRDVGTIGQLTAIENLQLRSVTLPDLSPLLPMRRLRVLYIGLGGTSDLSLLPHLAALEELELWRIRGLRDVSMLAAIPRLRSLRLESMSAVSELPSFADAIALRSIAMCAMKGIRDLGGVAAAPNLEELIISDLPNLEIETLRPLAGRPTLTRGIWGVGTRAKNHALYEILRVGQPPFDHPDFAAWLERHPPAEGEPA